MKALKLITTTLVVLFALQLNAQIKKTNSKKVVKERIERTNKSIKKPSSQSNLPSVQVQDVNANVATTIKPKSGEFLRGKLRVSIKEIKCVSADDGVLNNTLELFGFIRTYIDNRMMEPNLRYYSNKSYSNVTHVENRSRLHWQVNGRQVEQTMDKGEVLQDLDVFDYYLTSNDWNEQKFFIDMFMEEIDNKDNDILGRYVIDFKFQDLYSKLRIRGRKRDRETEKTKVYTAINDLKYRFQKDGTIIDVIIRLELEQEVAK